jgi:DNA-binding NtrC family response regulator
MARATVLIVDDEDLVRWSLKELITRDGHAVLEAGTAAAALDLMSDDVDLVLLDIRLPDGDGLNVLERMRKIAPDTPVILMTAYSAVQNSSEAMRLGAYEFVSKPFNVEEVSTEVTKAIETSRLRRELRRLRASGGEGRVDHEAAPGFALPPEGVRLEDVERQLLVQALERCGGNQTHAGELLGINRDQVRYRIEKFGLVRPSTLRARQQQAQEALASR